jgi:rhodanese-related sulfurtransferase
MLPYEIEPRDLENLKQDTGEPRFLLLDVREPWEYEIARLDGSVNMPMGDVPSRANAELDPDQRDLPSRRALIECCKLAAEPGV